MKNVEYIIALSVIFSKLQYLHELSIRVSVRFSSQVQRILSVIFTKTLLAS